MKRPVILAIAITVLLQLAAAQSKISVAAGTPEDQALQQITNEADAQKRTAMLQDFVQKFASNPAAVAYGNWQLSQQAGAANDPQKALEYGDKALAAMPEVVEILVSQIDFAQQAKNAAKVVDYATRGATIINTLDKKPKPEEMTDDVYAAQIASQKETLKPNYQYMEVAAYNAITGEKDARTRMPLIEKYLSAFPGSQFSEPLATLAIVSLQEMKDSAGLAAFGDKMLARNPKDMRLLTVLASAYSSDPTHLDKAGAYARRAIELEKTGAASNATDRKLAGVAHSVLGRSLLQSSKYPAAATELKTATTLLQDSPDDLAGAYYFLDFTYAKMERVSDAVAALTQASNIAGPYQQPSQELLGKIKAARTKR